MMPLFWGRLSTGVGASKMSFTTVAVSGTSSESGKTTLMCQLLREFPGWEAIKMTRGHYRSCGKDPHACCVSHLLSDEPVVRSGFQQTFADCKDTGKYWDAGASNVHWVIVTDDQVERGTHLALERIKAPGVLIEGNSFLQFVDVDFAILVAAPAKPMRIKPSTRWAYQKAAALYTFAPDGDANAADTLSLLRKRFAEVHQQQDVTAYTAASFRKLLARVNQAHLLRENVAGH
jgi:molybdopterin-guanine dinucleotide biosynthesis protein